MADQDETLVCIALNILAGNIDPTKWKGLRVVDEDDQAVLDKLDAIRKWGFGKMEVNVLHHQLDTVHQDLTFKRKDLVK